MYEYLLGKGTATRCKELSRSFILNNPEFHRQELGFTLWDHILGALG
jgi:hypothetical protein